MTQLEQNTTNLQSILDAVNALPEGGGGGGIQLNIKATYADLIEVFDKEQDAWITLDTVGTTIDVIDYVLLANLENLMDYPNIIVHKTNGTTAYADIAFVLKTANRSVGITVKTGGVSVISVARLLNDIDDISDNIDYIEIYSVAD